MFWGDFHIKNDFNNKKSTSKQWCPFCPRNFSKRFRDKKFRGALKTENEQFSKKHVSSILELTNVAKKLLEAIKTR